RLFRSWSSKAAKKKKGQALKAPARSQRQVGGGQPIVTGINSLASSRCTSNATVLPALLTSSLSCSGLFTGVRLKATITSPGRTPALAAAPPTCSTTTPSTTSPVLLSSGESERTATPSLPFATASFVDATVVGSSNAPIWTLILVSFPSRHTSTTTSAPGFTD